MPETKTLAPASVLAGPHQSVQPLPVDGSAGFIDSRVLGVATAGYMGGDGLAPDYVTNAMVLPEIAQAPSQIESALTSQVSYPDNNTPSLNTNWVLSVPQVIPLGALVELEVTTFSNPTVAAPGTPAGWDSRGSFHRDPVTGWFPRTTKFWRIKDDTWGGPGATVTVIWPSAVHPIVTWKAWANVDTSSPYDVAGPTANSSYSPFDPPASIGPTVTANAVVTVSCVGNIWPGGADSFNPSTQIPQGWTLTCSDHTKPRFSVCYHKRIASPGTTEDPPGVPIDPDHGIAITDVIRPALGQDLTCLLFVAVADETNTSWTGGTPPEIPARDEIQVVQSSLTSGTFTLTFSGQTTAGIAYNASAAAVQSALEALSNIAPGDVICTGGALDINPVSVEFSGAYTEINVPLMTTNTADVAVTELVRGRAAEQFWAEGFANIPQSATAGVPQAQIWALTPSVYPSGETIDFPVSDHADNHSFGAVLLVVTDLDTANPLEDTFGTWETGTAATSADLGTITPVVPGSRIISLLAKAKAPGTYYPGEAPLATVPSRYNRLGTGLADAMTVDLFLSAPVPAATEVMPTVSWVGAENFLAASTTIRPAASAGSLNIAQALASGQGAWVELANAAGSLYEVVEFDITSIPADAILTGASIRFSHEADTRNALRVSLVGIKADGSFQVASERRVGGYAPEPAGTVVTVDTGAFFEFSDGSHISGYTRLGALIWSTGRHPALSTHKLYELSLVLEYEPGGPVVSQVVGPNSPGEALEWVYSSGGGFPMTHSRVQIRTGWNEDPARVFADEYFTQFDSAPVGPDWELYDSDGNAGYGKRRPSAITNPINALAVSGTRVLQIEASNGTGADTGFVVSGGMKLKKPITYGEVEFRAWGTGDPDLIFSPVIILWPAISAQWPTEADVWPAGGELDIIECYGARDDLNPMETNIHRLALGAVPPFDASDDEVLQTYHAIDGTQPTKYIFRWLPEGLYLSIADAAFFPIVEDPLWIPDWPMEVTIQLDAWSNGPLTGGNNPKLLVDYLVLRRLIKDSYPTNPLAPATGDIIYDSGWMAGSSRRSLVIKDKPLSRGNQTALVKAKARLTSGTEVESKWAADEFFDISGNPEASGAQTADPVFNPATGAVEVTLEVPGATTARAWLTRSTDQGLSWSLAGPFGVSPSSTTRILDLEAPLAEPTLRYEVSFDAGPMTETSAPVAVGTAADISTVTTSWFFIVPKDHTMSTPVEVAGVSVIRPRRAQVAEDPGGSVVVSSPPLPIRMEMTLRSRDQATRERIDAILDSGETIRVVDIHGRSWWMKLATDVGEQMMRWAPLKTEHTGLRHAHEISFTLVETSKPV